jgi:hypothetical protein
MDSSKNRLSVIIKKQKTFCVDMLGQNACPGAAGVSVTVDSNTLINNYF